MSVVKTPPNAPPAFHLLGNVDRWRGAQQGVDVCVVEVVRGRQLSRRAEVDRRHFTKQGDDDAKGLLYLMSFRPSCPCPNERLGCVVRRKCATGWCVSKGKEGADVLLLCEWGCDTIAMAFLLVHDTTPPHTPPLLPSHPATHTGDKRRRRTQL